MLNYRQGEHKPRITSFQVLKQAVQQASEGKALRFTDAQSPSNALWAMGLGMIAMAFHLPQAFEPVKAHKAAEVMLNSVLAAVRQPSTGVLLALQCIQQEEKQRKQ